jgi:hypothetical protein
MALALTVFGVSYEGAPAVFCYAFFRDVRGSGTYPSPNIPKGKQTNGISRKAIQHFEGLELVCWDKTLDEAEAASDRSLSKTVSYGSAAQSHEAQ